MQGRDYHADGKSLKQKAWQYRYRSQIVASADACQQYGCCEDLE